MKPQRSVRRFRDFHLHTIEELSVRNEAVCRRAILRADRLWLFSFGIALLTATMGGITAGVAGTLTAFVSALVLLGLAATVHFLVGRLANRDRELWERLLREVYEERIERTKWKTT